MPHPTIERWHQIAARRDLQALRPLLAEDAVFVSPVMHTPQRGRALALAHLQAASQLLNNDSLRHVNESVGAATAALEFECQLDGDSVNGVVIAHCNADGLIDRFKVMLRPLQALHKVHELCARADGRCAAARGRSGGAWLSPAGGTAQAARAWPSPSRT